MSSAGFATGPQPSLGEDFFMSLASARISKCALLSGVALSASLILASAAQAQDTPAPAAGAPATATPSPQPADDAAQAQASSALGGGDIIVTAQRRSQNLLSVPLSITAVKGETL